MLPPSDSLPGKRLRVLHSFPHRLGKSRICTTAWHEIDSVAEAGAEMTVLAGDSVRPFQRPLRMKTTLAWRSLRWPYRLLGTRLTCALHDWKVAQHLPAMAGKIDIIHAWPLGALHTMRAAKKLGIPVALERCNAHTRFAYQVVKEECDRIGVPLPHDHEHAYNEGVLRREEAEYAMADGILCPSEFVRHTFLGAGFPDEKLMRFIYGVDEKRFHPEPRHAPASSGLKMVFVGVCAVRKGLHFALEAWLNSDACKDGQFQIAGDFIPGYRAYLESKLAHPSVKVLGHRDDIPMLMRESDLFVLPSIEEGFGLVCTEAMASGCVPLVSDACTDLCRHLDNSMVHRVANVAALTDHINQLHRNRELLFHLRAAGLRAVPGISWKVAGHSLLGAYRQIVDLKNTPSKRLALAH